MNANLNASTQLHMAGVLASPYADMRPPVQATPAYRQSGLNKYKRQLAETRAVLYQMEAMKMVSGEAPGANADMRREMVLKRVTREFWTNFVVRGEETRTLRALQQSLRREFGDDLQFFYPPGDIHMVILHDGEDGPEPVEPRLQAAIINRAWQLARDLVARHMA